MAPFDPPARLVEVVEVVAFPRKLVAVTEVKPLIVAGNESVTAPVLPDAVIWLAVPVRELTPDPDVK